MNSYTEEHKSLNEESESLNEENNEHAIDYIYALRLVQDKYYIGKTNDIDHRFAQHLGGYCCKGAMWTDLYEPIEVIDYWPKINSFDETTKTIEYMIKYGYENVRGGAFCSIGLSGRQLKNIHLRLLAFERNKHRKHIPNHKMINCDSCMRTTYTLINEYYLCKKCLDVKLSGESITCARCQYDGHESSICNRRKPMIIINEPIVIIDKPAVDIVSNDHIGEDIWAGIDIENVRIDLTKLKEEMIKNGFL